MIKFPFDTGKMWEVDLDTFGVCNWSTASIKDTRFVQTNYYADVIRGTTVHKDYADEVASDMDNLFKAGVEGGIEKFVHYGRTCDVKSLAIPRIKNYLTAYVNEMLKYVCSSTIAIEDFFQDYADLVEHSKTHPIIKFVLNLVDGFVQQFIEINKDEPTRLDIGVIEDNPEELSVIHRVRVNFTKAGPSFYKALVNTDGVTPVADKLGICIPVPKTSKLYGVITENIGAGFENGNRAMRVYYENINSTQGVGKLTVFKCMSDDYKIRLV